MTNFIPVNEPIVGEREKELVLDCLNSGWISSEGPYVSRFEDSFSRVVGRRYGIACANGTAALEIAVAALNLGVGDEVILPTFTIISCAAAIVRSGATPVVVDVNPDSWNMDPDLVAAAITPRTAAIMVVHIYGLPVDMDPIINLADRYGLALIEDAAELIGGTYKGKPCGSFGTISTFSFYPNKHITTGEGGMVVTNDSSLADRCRSLRNLCFNPDRRFVHSELGWNYRMTSLQAALGLAQLEQLDHFLKIKRRIGHKYNSAFQHLEHLTLPLTHTDYATNLYWVFGILLQADVSFDAHSAIQMMARLGVGCRPFFYPLHLQPIFKDKRLFDGAHHPVSERLYRTGFYIPSGLALTNEQIESVIESIRIILGEN